MIFELKSQGIRRRTIRSYARYDSGRYHRLCSQHCCGWFQVWDVCLGQSSPFNGIL